MNATPTQSTATYFGNYNVHVLDVSINLGDVSINRGNFAGILEARGPFLEAPGNYRAR